MRLFPVGLFSPFYISLPKTKTLTWGNLCNDTLRHYDKIMFKAIFGTEPMTLEEQFFYDWNREAK